MVLMPLCLHREMTCRAKTELAADCISQPPFCRHDSFTIPTTVTGIDLRNTAEPSSFTVMGQSGQQIEQQSLSGVLDALKLADRYRASHGKLAVLDVASLNTAPHHQQAWMEPGFDVIKALSSPGCSRHSTRQMKVCPMKMASSSGCQSASPQACQPPAMTLAQTA